MNIIALDMDGVIGDGYIGRVVDVEFESPFSSQELRKYGIDLHDAKSLDRNAILILLSSLGDQDQFVLVSSWISTRAEFKTYKMVEKLFQYVKPRQVPYFHGQTPYGNGGFHREHCFFKYIKEHFSDSLGSLEIFAIDDSGYRHFPVMETMQRLIAPRGLVGFCANEALVLKYLLKNFSSCYPESWMQEFVTTHKPKPIGVEGFELIFEYATHEYYSNMQKLHRLKV